MKESLLQLLTFKESLCNPIDIEVDDLVEFTDLIVVHYWMRRENETFSYSIWELARMFGIKASQLEALHCLRVRLIFACAQCETRFGLSLRSHFDFNRDLVSGKTILCHRCKLGIQNVERNVMNVLGNDPAKRIYFRELSKAFPIVLPNYPLAAFVDSEKIKHLLSATNRDRTLGCFLSCRVHFVACDLEGNPILAAEYSKNFLDDSKSEFKREVLSAVGIPYYRFPVHDNEVFRMAPQIAFEDEILQNLGMKRRPNDHLPDEFFYLFQREGAEP